VARKPRKYYQPRTAECRARISASLRAYHERCRRGLAALASHGASCNPQE